MSPNVLRTICVMCLGRCLSWTLPTWSFGRTPLTNCYRSGSWPVDVYLNPRSLAAGFVKDSQIQDYFLTLI